MFSGKKELLKLRGCTPDGVLGSTHGNLGSINSKNFSKRELDFEKCLVRFSKD